MAQATADTAAVSAQRAVQRFYDWYVPAVRREESGPVGALALRQRASLFALTLRNALARDTAAQVKAVGEIDGLDFDPFLASQDPCARYTTHRAMRRGSTYSVELRGSCSSGPMPDAVLDLARLSGAWMITNIRYPRNKSDLLTVLNELEAGRAR
jgi:hypothetical protein